MDKKTDVYLGKAHKYGDNIDTDIIIPGHYLKELDPKKLAAHAMEGIDPDFIKKVKDGDFIVAGKNFGCGSSREHAPLALKYAGIRAVLALSFARIFYRNAVDGGYLLPIEIYEDTYRRIDDGDMLEIDLNKNEVRNLSKGEVYRIKPFPEIVKKIIDAGGLFAYKLSE
ncbi:MAG: 3-isopropylmalate dehydratase small subunit [Nitrososphaerota archaeon]|nr:3-isopropylmalate dehydratase small subunit [Nitrososphaerales archaeon]MDW8044909.1 3-isopropylmalate dehydratase small subunit [Nitrososphaerota archaeon]